MKRITFSEIPDWYSEVERYGGYILLGLCGLVIIDGYFPIFFITHEIEEIGRGAIILITIFIVGPVFLYRNLIPIFRHLYVPYGKHRISI